MDNRLDDAVLSGLKCFGEDTEKAKLVTDKMREIVGRFMKGTNVNPDDFYFVLFDDKQENAFFLNKKFTDEKDKHVIAVSSGLVRNCRNEDELAGFIGHECGHFMWAETLGGNNTIVQEHAADMKAVDLMVNGGYNPMYFLEASKRLLHDNQVTFDVHGSDLSRINDIKAYLTVLANKNGQFAEIENKDNPNFAQFKKYFDQASGESRTYIDRLVDRYFPNQTIEDVDRFALMQAITTEIQNGKLTNQNYGILLTLTENVHSKFSEKVTDCSDENKKIFQNFVEQVYPLVYTTSHFDDNYEERSKIGKDVIDITKQFGTERFGAFERQYENIQNFLNAKDADGLLHWSEEMLKLRWTMDFQDFKYPYMKTGKVGERQPWEQNNMTVLEKTIDFPRSYYWANSVVRPRTPEELLEEKKSYDPIKRYRAENPQDETYNPDEFIYDYKNIILKSGAEAKAEKYQVEENKTLEKYNQLLDKARETTKFWNLLAQFDKENDNQDKKQELAAQLATYLNRQDEVEFKDFENLVALAQPYESPLLNRRPQADEFLKEFTQSEGYDYFKKNTTYSVSQVAEINYAEQSQKIEQSSPEQERETRLKNAHDTFQYDYKIRDINPKYQKEVAKNMVQAYCHLLPYLSKPENAQANHVVTNRLSEYRKELYNYRLENFSSMHNSDKEQERRADEVLQKYMFLMRDMPPVNLSVKILNDVAQSYDLNKSSVDLERFWQTHGIKDPHNVTCFLDNLKNTSGMEKQANDYLLSSEYNKRKDINDKILNQKAFSFGGLINAMRHDQDFDLVRLSERLVEFYDPRLIDGAKLAPIAHEACHENFLKLPLKDKLKVYDAFSAMNLFDENKFGKLDCFKTIVNEIENHPNKEEAMKITHDLLSEPTCRFVDDRTIKRDIMFVNEKNRLIEFYASNLAEKLGKDDGSQDYFTKINQATENKVYRNWDGNAQIWGLNQDKSADDMPKNFSFPVLEASFSQVTYKDILDRVAIKVEAQEKTALALSQKGKIEVSGEDVLKADSNVRMMNALISVLGRNEDDSKKLIGFLTHKSTPENIDSYLKYINNHKISEFSFDNQSFKLKKGHLKTLHENFWSVDLAKRSYIMNSIIQSYAKEKQRNQKKDKETLRDKKKRQMIKVQSTDDIAIDLVMDMNFEKTSPYYKEANRVVHTVYKHLTDYERGFILSALVAANQKDGDDTKMSGEKIGEGLKMFFENKGPAFVKFGQLLSYLPVIDKDIRRPLANLRDKADLPKRDEVFKLMKETLPDSEYQKISHVGKVMGAGSFFITVKVKYDDKDCVVALMRPNAQKLVKDGMKTIDDTITDLAQQNSDYKPMLNCVKQAQISAESETDIEKDYQKSVEAIKMYEKMKVITSAGEFKPEVAKWESYGEGRNEQVYKIMNMAKGQAMTSDKMTTEQKHDMAVAYVTMELCNLLSGQKWDTDRHQGQQNFDQNGFKKFVVGIFDTGAQIDKNPTLKDKVMLGEMLYGMVRAAKLGRSVGDYMLDKVKAMDKAGRNLNFNTLYIDNVQRGLMALSDVMTYQKEVKDKSGKVIQEEKSLSAEDLNDIVTGIVKAGVIDKKVAYTVVAKDILNHMRIRKGGGKSNLAGKASEQSKPGILIVTDAKSEPYQGAKHLDKPKAEIQAIENNEKQNATMGMKLNNVALKKVERE